MGEESWGLDGGPYPFQGDDLIIAAPHLNLVIGKLRDLDVTVRAPEVSDALGLARATLVDVQAAADRIMAAAQADPQARTLLHARGTGPLPLDRVLAGLRALFGAENAGWAPSLGKNRLVGRVHGVGEISHGGGGDPEPLDKPPALATRAAGPGRGVRVGLLDTRISPQPWLAGGWAARFSDTVSLDEGVPPFPEGHATFVAGLILSQAPGATVEARRVLDAAGQGRSWDVANEIVRFGSSGLEVLNLSFVCYTEDGQPPLVLATAVDRLSPELVVVAAAGNHGDADGEQRLKPAWPAALDDVVAVGAAGPDGQRAAFSPGGPWVDLDAPGVDLRSTYLPAAKKNGEDVEFDGFAQWQGTSFSAALVSGAVAAATQPGRVSARAAYQDIRQSLEHEDASRSKTERPRPRPFLNLRTL
jgi:hypothetical protein